MLYGEISYIAQMCVCVLCNTSVTSSTVNSEVTQQEGERIDDMFLKDLNI